MTSIWEHEGKVENSCRRRVFSSFLECSQVFGVFYHSVIHSLGFFIYFMIEILHTSSRKNEAHTDASKRLIG